MVRDLLHKFQMICLTYWAEARCEMHVCTYWHTYWCVKLIAPPCLFWYITRGSAHWACIAHLTIEWYWSKFQREIIITLKNSSHLEWRVGLSDTILKGTHPGTIYAKFGSIWPSCFRGEDFFNISQSEKRINLGSHVCRPNGTKWRNFIEDLT